MRATRDEEPRRGILMRLAINVPVALLIVALIGLRLGVVQSVRIASVNMAPTLVLDDRVMVRAYGAEPRHGDVVVYHSPFDYEHFQIGRVVAVEGQSIELTEGGLVLDGQAVTAPGASTCAPDGSITAEPCPAEAVLSGSSEGDGCRIEQWLIAAEKLGSNCYYTRRAGALSSLLFPKRVVPAGHFFVLSDNRADERDSRIYGAIPHHAIVGVASFVYYAFDETGIRWDRMTRRLS